MDIRARSKLVTVVLTLLVTVVLALLATVVLILALTACSRFERRPRARDAVVLEADVDTSGSTDTSKRCAEAAAHFRSRLDDRRAQRVDALILATGDGATGGEPRVLVPWTSFQPAHDLYATPEAVKAARTAWLAALTTTCEGAVRASRASPVYELVERSLEAVSARCKEIESSGFTCVRRSIVVASDMRSTFGPFGRYLTALAKRPKKPPAPPPKLDLSGVEFQVCDFSNTDARDGLPAEVVLRAWRAVLGAAFTPDPVCEADVLKEVRP